MPKKKLTEQELGIPTLRQQNTLREIKSLARISQAHRVINAAYRNDQSRNDKQTQTDPEDHLEAEIVGNLDIAEVVPHQGNALNIAEVIPQQGTALDVAEVVPQQGNAHELNRHSWIITGILLALWIRLLL